MLTLIIANFTTSTRTDISLQTSVTFLRAFTMFGTISPIYWCDITFIKTLRNVYCPNTMCLAILSFTKSFSITWKNWLSMSSIQVHLPNPPNSLWRTNKFIFFEIWPSDLHFRRDAKINSSCYWRLVLSNIPKPKVSTSIFEKNLSANPIQAYTSLCPKEQKKLHFWHNRVDFPLVSTVIRKLISSLNFHKFNLK